MKRILFYLILFAGIVSCNKQDKLKVVETSFDDEVPVNSSLGFTFNEPVVPDSLVGIWTETPYVQFTPEVDGSFKWTSTEKLVFIPRKNLAPSTNYSCKVTNKVLEFLDKFSLGGATEFSFNTPMLELEDTRAYWDVSDETGTKPVLKLNMSFNQAVDPTEVAKLLNVKLDKKEVTAEVIGREPAEEISFVVKGIETKDKDLSAEVTLNSGLGSVGGTIKTSNDFEQDFDIPSPFKLNILNVQTGHNGSEGTVSIYTTQGVKEEGIKNFLSINPKVFYEVEVFPDYFLIKSEDFMMEQKYEITIKKGLQGKVGGELRSEYSQPLSFGEVEPSIRFNDPGEFYVSGKGSRNIDVSIINVPNVNVRIIKIYENNLVSFLRSYNDYGYRGYDDYYYDDYYYGSSVNADDLGDVVFEKEISVNNLPQRGINRVLSLDFEDKLGQYPGIYLIEVRDSESYWRKAKKLLSISDIGLIVKQGKNNLTVFANSIKSAEPIANAEVTFVGRNNQVTFSGTTDANGLLIYNHDEFAADGFDTRLVTAKLGSDFNIVPFNRTRVNTSRFEVGGLYQNQSGLQAYIYGDRNLYRPGETIHISAIIRDYDWKSPSGVPVTVKITTPNGKTLKRLKKSLNEFGSLETSVALSPAAATGYYAIDVYTSTDLLIGSTSLKVEEFMPDRIKVSLKLPNKEFKSGDMLEVNLTATNMFGPPASDRNYEIEISTSRASFYSKDHPRYNYYIKGADSYFSNFYRDGETDAEGKVYEEFGIPNEWENMGVLRSSIYATVFDETGRPVNRFNTVKIFTQDVFYGIKQEDYYVKTGQPARFDLIAVDRDGKALDETEATMELIRHEYKTVLSRSGSYFRYRSEEIENTLEKKTITLNGTADNFSFIPDLSGRYELRVYAPGAKSYVSQSLYAYGWGSTSYSSFKVNKEGQIDIAIEKDKYDVGEKAKVLIKTPFQGKVLVTIETDKVLDHFYLNTDKRAASFELDIKDNYVPNVYISATLFKPHNKSDVPLTVAHGFAPVKVEKAENKMQLTIDAVEKSRSNVKQVIRVKGAPNSAVTIAAVDEGILQVGGYANPNPYDYFYQKRALEVESYNIYPYLFPELGAIRSSTGGGAMEGDLSKRINPLQNNRVKLVAFWSGILKTNNKGEAEYEIDIPQFSGSLRLMAVGYNGAEIFGANSQEMKVADPIVQSVSLPRFLSPGDKIRVPVMLTNTTNKPAKCKTGISVSGPLTLIGEKSKSVNVAPNAEQEVVFELDADYVIGQSSVTVTTSALGEEFVNKTDIAVRPASPLQKRSGSGLIAGGKSKTIEINSDAFMESSADYKLVVSNNPLVQFTNSLDYLVRYPHGCVEQTVSKAFPQVYFSDLLSTVYTNKRASEDASNNVQAALDKIKLMQLYNGGLTYWPGGGSGELVGNCLCCSFCIGS